MWVRRDTRPTIRVTVWGRVLGGANLNGWDESGAGLSQGWVRSPSGLASLHHSRLSTQSSYQLYSFSGDRRFCHDNHGSFVYDSLRVHNSIRTRACNAWSLHCGHTCQLLESWSRDTWDVRWVRQWSRSDHCEGEALGFVGGSGGMLPRKILKTETVK